MSVADTLTPKPLPLMRMELEARVGIALKPLYIGVKMTCFHKESSGILPNPV